LLALGEQASAAFPVRVTLEGHQADLQISVDGQSHTLSSALGGGWQKVALLQPGPLEREYQVDGSDTTSTNDRQPGLIRTLLDTPLYRLDAFLRDEDSYSRWENLRLTDLSTGQAVAADAPLPTDFRLEVNLRRPEAPARIWLVGGSPDQAEGLELDRDRRNARWLVQRGADLQALPRWFFPEQPAPFAAELLQLLGRSAAAGYVLVVLAVALGWLAARLSGKSPKRGGDWTQATEVRPSDGSGRPGALGGTAAQPSDAGAPRPGTVGGMAGQRRRAASREVDPSFPPPGVPASSAGVPPPGAIGGTALYLLTAGSLVLWLIGVALLSTREYHQLPHILDAVAYSFQAGLFSTGQLSLPAPPFVDAFKGPFEVLWQNRLFSQYPPGASAIYALGDAVGLGWLVGPLACAVLIGATAWSARALFGPTCGLAVLVLGLISPFVAFQAGSFLSHPIAGGMLAAALAAFVAGECRGSLRWYAVCGALLGAAFVAREAASVLFALPLGVRLLATRRWSALSRVVAFGLPFVLAYLVFNLRETGNALLLPRMIFDPTDHFGFGDGIGFHTRHTLAAGLANTDELLTLLQFELFGWPPLFALGLLGVPFLVGRARVWDWMALGGILAFVVAYVGYFYHGIALGPRYYFEAMPWLLLLGGRGAAVLAEIAGSWIVAIALVGALTLNTFLLYLPAEADRRQDMSGLPGATPLVVDFVQPSVFGPRLVGVPDGSLVLTSDWWIYTTALASLNCPRVPNCPVLFALATTPEAADRLHTAFPDRTSLRVQVDNGHVSLAAD
jgi:hypothetical protein